MKQKAAHKGRSPGGGGSGVLDRNLIPRIENYASNNDYTDVDEVAEYLRRAYKEYARKPSGPFRQMISKAVQIIQARGGVPKAELALQVRCETGAMESGGCILVFSWPLHEPGLLLAATSQLMMLCTCLLLYELAVWFALFAEYSALSSRLQRLAVPNSSCSHCLKTYLQRF